MSISVWDNYLLYHCKGNSLLQFHIIHLYVAFLLTRKDLFARPPKIAAFPGVRKEGAPQWLFVEQIWRSSPTLIKALFTSIKAPESNKKCLRVCLRLYSGRYLCYTEVLSNNTPGSTLTCSWWKDAVSTKLSAPFLVQESYRFHLFSWLLYPKWLFAPSSAILCFEHSLDIVSVLGKRACAAPGCSNNCQGVSFNRFPSSNGHRVHVGWICSAFWANHVALCSLCTLPFTVLPKTIVSIYRWKRKDMFQLCLRFPYFGLPAAIMQVVTSNELVSKQMTQNLVAQNCSLTLKIAWNFNFLDTFTISNFLLK